MAGNTFGRLFTVTTFGESHGPAIGCIVDGCPPGIELTPSDLQGYLDRRRPGQSRHTTQRREPDEVRILSGVFEGRTLGSPIAILVRNKDARPEAYSEMSEKFRPSHADYTTEAKYGIRNWQGGGRARAQETVGRVAAGAIARKLLEQAANAEVLGWVCQVHEIDAAIDPGAVTLSDVEANPVRCPDPAAAAQMAEQIDAAREYLEADYRSGGPAAGPRARNASASATSARAAGRRAGRRWRRGGARRKGRRRRRQQPRLHRLIGKQGTPWQRRS